jgi:hypothetical protein
MGQVLFCNAPLVSMQILSRIKDGGVYVLYKYMALSSLDTDY